MEGYPELRRAARLFTLALLGGGLWLLFRFFPTLPLPFLLGLVIGGSIHVLAKKLSSVLHLPKKFCAILLLLLLLGLLGFLIFLLGARLAREVQELPQWLEENASGPTGIFHTVGEFFTRLGDRFPILGALRRLLPEEMQGDVGESLSSLLSSLLSRFSSTLSTLLLRWVALAPGALVSAFVTILSCYYFATDGGVILSGALSLLPEGARRKAGELLPLLRSALRRYARTYLLLMLLTFSELVAGFLFLRVPYALLLALLISLLDVLPLFGAGTVLLPWALICFLVGNPTLGSGLLILYGAMTVVRQLIEPRLLGKNLGIHPFATLLTMYVGLRLFGFAGLILSPMVAFLFKELRQNKNASAP